ncbi:MAG: c-type cytochrome domain-containing protein [Pirellulales bacterium]
MRHFTLLSTLLCLVALPAVSSAQEPVSFTKQVAPLLVKNCIACHGATDPKGGYQLSNFEQLMKPGDSATASIVPGKPAESEIFRLITIDDKDQWMPKDGDKLPADQVALISKWIEEGANFDSPDPKAMLASIIPKPAHPAAPEAYRVPMPITAVCFNPPGTELAVSGYNEITIWNPADGKLLRRIGNVAQRTYALQYNADGSLLAAASGTPGQMGEVKLFNPADGTIVKDLATMSDVAFDVAFSPDGTRLAACSADRSIRVWNVASGAQEILIEDHADWVMGIAWNHDGTRLASASRDKTAKVFDAIKGESLVTFPGHNEVVFGVDFNADGTQVFTAGKDRKVQIWNPNDAAKIAELGGFGNEVYKVNILGNRVFCCAADNQGREFAVDSRGQTRVFQGHTDFVFAESFNDPTKRLATGSFDGEVKIWNTEDGMLLLSFKAAPGLTPPAAP